MILWLYVGVETPASLRIDFFFAACEVVPFYKTVSARFLPQAGQSHNCIVVFLHQQFFANCLPCLFADTFRDSPHPMGDNLPGKSLPGGGLPNL
jgi:hypothetical protein